MGQAMPYNENGVMGNEQKRVQCRCCKACVLVYGIPQRGCSPSGGEEIKRLSENENIFGAPTRMRATQIFNTVSARVKSLDDSFYPIFEACDLASQKLFALVAAMSYDEKLAHLTLSRIQLDLDDGVKKNYRKIQTANDGKFYEVLADSKNIMSKE